MKSSFLEQFLDRISKFPNWIKEIIYNRLTAEVGQTRSIIYDFVSYKPLLTYKGMCKTGKQNEFDINICNIIKYAKKGYSISDIILNSFLSVEEAAKYFLLCLDLGYFEKPDNVNITNIAEILSGKTQSSDYSNEEYKNRFVIDYNDVPKIKSAYENEYTDKIKSLENENKILRKKLEQLLVMVKNND